ncbi:MAG: response regulator transcription factor [Lachnospiraceae bacterium]|nr:response regulator transcription factor [Lachnospiraceae bacterium]
MHIAICDDDADFADNLKALMEKELAALHVSPVISVYNDGAVFIADRLECDAVFLDIDMPAVNGFDIAEQINRMGETLIVFVTMHDELVYSSIKFQPFRFIRKSHLAGELPEVLSALNKTMCKRNAGRKFGFQTKTGTVFLDVSSIEYIEIYGHWLHVCVDGGEDLECYGSLSEFEKELAPFDFIRTHKSYLVNCKYIYAIEKGHIVLDDKTEILLSRYRAGEVRDKFRSYIRSEL